MKKILLTEKTDYYLSQEYSEKTIERSMRRLRLIVLLKTKIPKEIVENEIEILRGKIMFDRSIDSSGEFCGEDYDI